MVDEKTKELAIALVDEIKKEKHDFWINGERHYRDHQVMEHLDMETVLELKQFASDYKQMKGTGMKVFVRLIILGAFVLAVFGFLGAEKMSIFR